MIKPVSILAVLAAAVPLAGCPADDAEPIVGEWEGSNSVSGQRNTLEIFDDLEGDARVWFYFQDRFGYADFKVRVDPRRERVYDLRFDCRGDCAIFDIEMECEVGRNGDRMECEADGLWSNYQFEWRLR
jgi:hypothetical protein